MPYHGPFSEHATTMQSLAAFNSFGLTGPELPQIGAPLGRRDNGMPMFYAPGPFAEIGAQNTPSALVFGDQDAGKSTLVKLLLAGIGSMKKYPNDPHSPWRRVWADDPKGQEYGPLADYFNRLPNSSISMVGRKINPVPSTTPRVIREQIISEILGLLGQALTPDDLTVVSAGFETLDDLGIPSSPHSFQQVLNQADRLQPPRLNDETDERLVVDRQVFEASARSITARLQNVLKHHGSVFTSDPNAQLDALAQQRFTAIDFDFPDRNLARVMHHILWSLRLEDMREINVLDEAHSVVGHREFSGHLKDKIKKGRKENNLFILITQRFSDYLDLPEEQRNTALTVVKEIPLWFVGKTEDTASLKALFESRGINESHFKRACGLQQYQFMLVFADKRFEPVVFTTHIPRYLRPMVRTNQERDKEIGRKESD